MLSAGQVLVGPAGERIADGAVLVTGDEITAVGPRAQVERLASAATARVAFPEGTVLPGLIDCHVHLTFDPAGDPRTTLEKDGEADVALKMAHRARRLLESGVTTVRDLGDWRRLTLPLRAAVNEGRIPGPRIVAATTPLTSPGGHCGFLGGEADGEAEIRALVRDIAAAGADLVKVMVTGGHLTPSGPAMWESQFTAAQLAVITAEAHALGLPVAAHAHGTDGIADAVAAGVDTIEHCTWIHDTGFLVPEDVVTRIVEQGIFVCPAVSRNWRGYAERFGPQVAEELLGRYRWLDERGVRLVAGTDAGIPGAVFDDYVSGLEAFRHSGIGNDRIIELATVEAASALRLAHLTGRLAAGHSADLLAVDGDPRADLDALRAVRLVVAQGRALFPGPCPGS